MADALGHVDEHHAVDYAGEAAGILARAGRTDEARDRVRANLSRFGDIPYTWLAAGEALAALGDVDVAADAYDRAVEVAEERDEPTEVADACEHLEHFLEAHPDASSRMRAPRTRVHITGGPEGQVVVRATTTLGGFTGKVPPQCALPMRQRPEAQALLREPVMTARRPARKSAVVSASDIRAHLASCREETLVELLMDQAGAGRAAAGAARARGGPAPWRRRRR